MARLLPCAGALSSLVMFYLTNRHTDIVYQFVQCVCMSKNKPGMGREGSCNTLRVEIKPLPAVAQNYY